MMVPKADNDIKKGELYPLGIETQKPSTNKRKENPINTKENLSPKCKIGSHENQST